MFFLLNDATKDSLTLGNNTANILTAKSTGFTCVPFSPVLSLSFWQSMNTGNEPLYFHCSPISPAVFTTFPLPFWKHFKSTTYYFSNALLETFDEHPLLLFHCPFGNIQEYLLLLFQCPFRNFWKAILNIRMVHLMYYFSTTILEAFKSIFGSFSKVRPDNFSVPFWKPLKSIFGNSWWSIWRLFNKG